MKKDVCVIGAGVAGLVAARFLRPHFNVTVLERTHSIGGVWRYNKDTSGEKKEWTTPMYRNLRSNLPRHLMSFSDHDYPDTLPSFLTHEHVMEYLESYCERFRLREVIRFGVAVTGVEPIGNGAWTVTTDDGASAEYGGVVVATGKYDTPDIPAIPGLASLPHYEHSKAYSAPSAYAGQHVLVVGAHASGVDIVVDLAEGGVRVDLSHRAPQPKMGLPPGVRQLGEPLRAEGGLLYLRGQEEGIRFDNVIFATGYGSNLDFLSPACGLEGEVLPRPLYRYLLNPTHPTMAVMAQCTEIAPFLISEYQARYFTAVLNGDVKLGPPEQLEREAWELWEEKRGLADKYRYRMALEQFRYCKELASATEITPPHDLDALCDLYDTVGGKRALQPTLYRKAEYAYFEETRSFQQVG